MRAIDLDFVRSTPASGPLGLLLFVAGMLCAGLTTLEAFDAREARELEQERHSGLERRLRAPGARAAPAGQPSVDEVRAIAAANRIIARLNAPWQRVLIQAAEVAGPTIALTGLAPDTQSRTLRIAGVAPSLADVYAYVERLQEVSGFARAHLVQHAAAGEAGDARVAFQVVATWTANP